MWKRRCWAAISAACKVCKKGPWYKNVFSRFASAKPHEEAEDEKIHAGTIKRSWYALIGALEQGFVYGIMVLGVYLTFRVLDFPDLTVDGSLPLGASVSAVAITHGVNPFVSLGLAAAAGFAAGAVTALLNTKLKILHLLASILTMIALYSINIRIMGGPNVSLLGVETVFDPISAFGLPGYLAAPVLYAGIALAITGAIIWFLNTEMGLALMATGDNPQMITSQGVNTDCLRFSL